MRARLAELGKALKFVEVIKRDKRYGHVVGRIQAYYALTKAYECAGEHRAEVVALLKQAMGHEVYEVEPESAFASASGGGSSSSPAKNAAGSPRDDGR